MIVIPKSGIPYYRLRGKTPLNNTRLSVAFEFSGIINPQQLNLQKFILPPS